LVNFHNPIQDYEDYFYKINLVLILYDYMTLTPVFCELKDNHIVVYQSDGETRHDHGIYNIITGDICRICGDPLMLKMQDEFHCLESYLHNSLKDADGVFQLGYYHKKYSTAKLMENDMLSKDILGLKSNPNYAIPLAKSMFLLMKNYFPILLDVDVIVPVPNHIDDFHSNAKAIALSNELANEYMQAEKSVEVIHALSKIKNTSTHNLSRPEREETVKDMFQFNTEESVREKNIALVDDVLTAGNIKGKCASILKENGAKKVWCFIAGRTI